MHNHTTMDPGLLSHTASHAHDACPLDLKIKIFIEKKKYTFFNPIGETESTLILSTLPNMHYEKKSEILQVEAYEESHKLYKKISK